MNVDKSSGASFFTNSDSVQSRRSIDVSTQRSEPVSKLKAEAGDAGVQREGTFRDYLEETVRSNREAQRGARKQAQNHRPERDEARERPAPADAKTARSETFQSHVHKEETKAGNKDVCKEETKAGNKGVCKEETKAGNKGVCKEETKAGNKGVCKEEMKAGNKEPVDKGGKDVKPETDAGSQVSEHMAWERTGKQVVLPEQDVISDWAMPPVSDPLLASLNEPEGTGTVEPTATESSAAEVLRSSVTEIAQMLSLSVGGDSNTLALTRPTDWEKDQLAEIMTALKGISAVLTEAASAHQALELGGQVIEPEELAQLDVTVRGGLFRIEYALNMLGLSGEMANRVAGKNDTAPMNGIAVAVDPKTCSHPVAVGLRSLTSEAPEPEPSIDDLVRKLALALKNENRPELAAVQEGNLARAIVNKGRNPLADIGQLDSGIKRHLLKVDTDATAEQNQAAADANGRMDLPKTQTLVMGRSFTAMEGVTAGNAGTPLPTATAGETGVQALMDLGATEPRFSHSLERVEQAVLQQVTSRLQNAVKSGLGTHEVRMMLRPETLGEVHLKVQMEGDIVTTQIHVENQQVKQIIENNFQTLKNALVEHNLQTGSFSVDVGSGGMHESGDDRAAFMRGSQRTDADEAGEIDEQPGLGRRSGIETGRRYGSNSIEYFA